MWTSVQTVSKTATPGACCARTSLAPSPASAPQAQGPSRAPGRAAQVQKGFPTPSHHRQESSKPEGTWAGTHGPWRWRPARGDSGLPASLPACLIPPASDDDECRAQPSPCANGRCINTMGSFHCVCDEGYQPSPSLTECQGECDKVPVWHHHLGVPRGWGQGWGHRGGYPASPDTCSSHAPSFLSLLQSPPPHRNMRACPCCPIITPRKRPSPSSPLHGAKPGGRPSGTRCPGDLSVLVPRVLVAFSLHTSAPGAQSPPLSFRPGGCIQLPPIPPQPPRPPDAVHTRTSSEPRLSDALIPTQTPQARLPK